MIDFLQQGGYAGYVWSAFGMTFGLLLIEILQLRSSHRTTLTRIARLVRLRTPRRKPAAGAGQDSGAASAKP
ncbi:heme exporter protein CcmD [Halochromatium glycolicum]|jgi:heme exporter protein D|uniref:Heme exporter protein D n=1 Tax=Halochromatium glycolicum TaxID=85075 RepID=A0AAJ0X8K8_9GAMM|nr:heme exporter protein CcmD [Halochromatium glycolicum]MBK1703999.1 heme exporter protein CcmD [Halochromatium glycolicum]NBC47037.1 heme exporter protein CcmD [Gammaproteobacteria bacterium]